MRQNRKEPELFKAYPKLSGKIPWTYLGVEPTPLEKLDGFGHEDLWIKRDDLSAPDYGGNKVRKLEFILGKAVVERRKRVITFGGIGTNHGLATAIYCRKKGLDCSVVVFDQPVTQCVKKNLRLLRKTGAEIVFGNSMVNSVIKFYLVQRLRHPGAVFLTAGGSSPVGTLGFIDAAFELKKQVGSGMMPEPDYIFCAVGSNGTHAGLHLGCLLAGLKSKVIGVRVSMDRLGPFDVCTTGAVHKLARNTLSIMNSLSQKMESPNIPQPMMLDDYLGAGYGYPTEKGGKALAEMESCKGLQLDPCYTAKTFAAVLDFCKSEKNRNATILFWNTYNSADLDCSCLAADLPPQIRTILEAEEVDIN